MVYTLTLNPSLDYTMRPERFVTGETNRSLSETVRPGGKGVNVAIVLRAFGVPVRALGVVAGFTGDEILRLLALRGVDADMVRTQGFSRINVKLKADTETEINGRGAVLTDEALDGILSRLRGIPDGSHLVLAGSAPADKSNVYARILSELRDKNLCVTADTTKTSMDGILGFCPYLIKPNLRELEEMSGRVLKTRRDIFAAAESLRAAGARNVIVSLGGRGAMMIAEDGRWYETGAPNGKVVGTVGAGDSLTAAFLASKIQGCSDEEAFLRGVCAGSASAFSGELATPEGMTALRGQLAGCAVDRE